VFDPSLATPEVDCDHVPSLSRAWRGATKAADERSRRTVARYIIDCAALRGRPRSAVRRMLGRTTTEVA
jgi:hypothetical protein